MSLKNPVTPLGIDTGTVRLVAQRFNHYATPAPILAMWVEKNHGNFKLDIPQEKLEGLSQIMGDREYKFVT